MNIIKKILFAPLVGYKWVSALGYAAKGDYMPSLACLSSLEPFFGNKDVEYHLLKGYLNFAIGDDIVSVRHIRISLNLLDKTDRYKEEEKKYLACYASVFGSKARSHIQEALRGEPFDAIDYDNVKLSSVGKALKKNFPLRHHPDWIEDDR